MGLVAGIIAIIEASKYGILFVTTLLGSPVVMIGAGYLIHLGQLEFWYAYATVVAADIIGDIAWYWIGRKGARPFFERFGKYVGVSPELLDRVESRFLRYHERILIASKLTMGFGAAIAVLAAAGMARTPFWRYLAINLSGELLWALIPIALGYYYGNLSALIPDVYRIWIDVGFFLVAVCAFQFGLRWLAKKEW